MPAKSLEQLALRCCVNNVRSLAHCYDMPYSFMRPILLKVQNPQQLRDIEKTSPQIIGEDAELWLGFIERDITDWEDKMSRTPAPSDPANWHRVYKKLLLENNADIDTATAQLQAAMEGLRAEREKTTSMLVDPSQVSRLGGSGMKRKRPAASGGWGREANMSSLSFNSGKLKSGVSGKAVLDKVRREAKEASLFSARKRILSTPTHKLAQQSQGQIRRAPQGLVEQHRRGPERHIPTPAARTGPSGSFGIRKPSLSTAMGSRLPAMAAARPGMKSAAVTPSSTAKSTSNAASGSILEEREKRLRALTGGSSSGPQASNTPRAEIEISSSSTKVPPRSSMLSPPNSSSPMRRPPAKVDPFLQPKRRKVN
ncbi:hypothetical protein MMC25_002679 [Agyrium rufum]|nr:hypothetical protein [Agyrium rufum]